MEWNFRLISHSRNSGRRTSSLRVYFYFCGILVVSKGFLNFLVENVLLILNTPEIRLTLVCFETFLKCVVNYIKEGFPVFQREAKFSRRIIKF